MCRCHQCTYIVVDSRAATLTVNVSGGPSVVSPVISPSFNVHYEPPIDNPSTVLGFVLYNARSVNNYLTESQCMLNAMQYYCLQRHGLHLRRLTARGSTHRISILSSDVTDRLSAVVLAHLYQSCFVLLLLIYPCYTQILKYAFSIW